MPRGLALFLSILLNAAVILSLTLHFSTSMPVPMAESVYTVTILAAKGNPAVTEVKKVVKKKKKKPKAPIAKPEAIKKAEPKEEPAANEPAEEVDDGIEEDSSEELAGSLEGGGEDQVQEIVGSIESAMAYSKGNRKPPYPALARKRGYQGTVTLKLTIGEDERITAVEIVDSSGYTIIDNPTAQYIKKKWRLPPNMVMQIPIKFELNEKS